MNAPALHTEVVHSQRLLLIDLLAYIDEHIGESDLDGNVLAAAFGLSRATVYRMFHGRGGISSYIRDKRLTIAHRYLQTYPHCSLTWLLYEMGFASERQFQRAFQQRFGMSPAQWRRQCRADHLPRRARQSSHYLPMWRFVRELTHLNREPLTC